MGVMMSEFRDAVDKLIVKVRKAVADSELDPVGFEPLVFVLKADGEHEVLEFREATRLVGDPVNRDLGVILAGIAGFVRDYPDAYTGKCLGVVVVGAGTLVSVRMADLPPHIMQAISDGEVSPEIEDELQTYLKPSEIIAFIGCDLVGVEKGEHVMLSFECRTVNGKLIMADEPKGMTMTGVAPMDSGRTRTRTQKIVPAEYPGRFQFGMN